MRLEERLEQLAMLCFFSGWTLEQLEKEATRIYPKGPTPTGNGWTKEQLEAVYAAAYRDRE